MTKIFEKPIISIILLAILSYFLFFYGVGEMALTDPDETFYAQTAKEMLDRNEWSTPYLYGKPQFEKPVFFYMIVELSYRVFGVNEFAARLPSAVFAFLGLVALYLLGSVLFNRRVGFLAALILGASIEYMIWAGPALPTWSWARSLSQDFSSFSSRTSGRCRYFMSSRRRYSPWRS